MNTKIREADNFAVFFIVFFHFFPELYISECVCDESEFYSVLGVMHWIYM